MDRLELKVCLLITAIFSLRVLGLMMILPVLPLYIASFNGGAASVGLIVGVYGIVQAILQLPLGYLSDLYGRRPIILVGLLLLLLGSLVGYFTTSIKGMVIGRALQGSGAIGSTLLASLADNTSVKSRTVAMAVLGAFIGASFFLSLILGPVIAANFGFKAIFLFVATLSVIAILFLPSLPDSKNIAEQSSNIVGKLVKVVSNTDIIRLDCSIMLLHFFYTAAFVLVPVVLLHNYDMNIHSHSYFYATCLILSLPFSVTAIMRAEKYNFVTQALILALMSFLFLFTVIGFDLKNFLLFCLSIILFFAGFTYMESVFPSLVSKIVSKDIRGTAMGVFSCCQFLGIFFGGVVTGFLQEYFGNYGMFSLVIIILIIWVWVLVNIKQSS
jgi:MFS family permease